MSDHSWQEPNNAKGTDILIKILERFGMYGEPLAMLVVYTDVNGDVWMKTNCVNTHALGLAEYASHNIKVSAWSEHDDPNTP
jgi:hypothetical protein